MTVKQLAPRMARLGGPVAGRATVNARGVGPAFAATLVDVEIDPDTGKIQVLRCTIAQDVGKATHPSYVEGQMQGVRLRASAGLSTRSTATVALFPLDTVESVKQKLSACGTSDWS